MNAYDETEPFTLGGYQDGGHCFFHNSLIWGENLTNVSITGSGMISGGGLAAATMILDEMVRLQHTGRPPVHKSLRRRFVWATKPSR